uniref:Uncharacterized protein n=1 Tax=Picea glauca TaxID=3330 RepID=A0A101LXU0_PICGL|nr:hypothetical protein ABT39_MTgene6164 [Picea glauca]QHR88779.1 hypothetical protein Q903MT_gene2794 [Picea sitchensis]
MSQLGKLDLNLDNLNLDEGKLAVCFFCLNNCLNSIIYRTYWINNRLCY